MYQVFSSFRQQQSDFDCVAAGEVSAPAEVPVHTSEKAIGHTVHTSEKEIVHTLHTGKQHFVHNGLEEIEETLET